MKIRTLASAAELTQLYVRLLRLGWEIHALPRTTCEMPATIRISMANWKASVAEAATSSSMKTAARIYGITDRFCFLFAGGRGFRCQVRNVPDFLLYRRR